MIVRGHIKAVGQLSVSGWCNTHCMCLFQSVGCVRAVWCVYVHDVLVMMICFDSIEWGSESLLELIL